MVLGAFIAGCAGIAPRRILAADIPTRVGAVATRDMASPKYYWRTTSVEDGAQIVTLFCEMSSPASDQAQDVPLVAVLRDTLGDDNARTDRLRYVWLLSYAHPSWSQEALSAVPFFYWRVGSGQNPAKHRAPKPLIDISQPSNPLVPGLARDILQWSLFDPMMMPVRASTRTYRTNELDDERLHLEQAIGYLRQAPVAPDGAGDPSALSQSELNTVIARLSLRTHLLGGLVSAQQAEKMGEADGFTREIVRSRNLESLRVCAEKAGLIVEPVSLAGRQDEYAVLWYPVDRQFPRADSPLHTVWKILSIGDPSRGHLAQDWRGPRFERTLDTNGSLLPEGSAGTPVQLIPLAVYGLNYPAKPLLLADFRNTHSVRVREMSQRVIDDTFSAILGLSHFTNWYVFAGEDFFEFIRSHRGDAVNRLARLDCFSQFRVELALDHDLDPALRKEMLKRGDSMALNPLEVAPSREIAVAQARYLALIADADAGVKSKLVKRLTEDRRVELAEFGRTNRQQLSDALLHQATFGAYSRRVKASNLSIPALDRERRIEYNLAFLDKLVQAGTDPEVTHPVEQIRESVNTLAELTPGVHSRNVRTHAAATIGTLKKLSPNPVLQADCARAIAGINAGPRLLDVDARIVPSQADLASTNAPAITKGADTER